MPAKKNSAINWKDLRKTCLPSDFKFNDTSELKDELEFLGQDRAIKAASLGLSIDRSGFNVFALGPMGFGKRSLAMSLLKNEAKKRHDAKDICYVYNFDEPRRPKLMLLKPGLGTRLSDDMKQLVEVLKTSIPAIFESKGYKEQIAEIQEKYRKKQEKDFSKIELEADKNEIAIIRTAQGFAFAARKGEEIMSEEEFALLPKKERDAKDKIMQKLRKELSHYFEQLPQAQKKMRENIKEILRYFTLLQVGSAIFEVEKKYQNEPVVSEYLRQVQNAILENPAEFDRSAEKLRPFGIGNIEDSPLSRYQINVVVDNGKIKGAPIVFEDNPTFANLMGHLDYESRLGALITDFTHLRAGALHRANGGFLVVDALKILMNPFAWDGLKRALRSKEIQIENLSKLMGYVGTSSLDPEPVPLKVKVILIGERSLYYLLCAKDPDFSELFKIAADFNHFIDRDKKNTTDFARFINHILKKEDLKPMHSNALAKTLEFGSRLASDGEKISTHMRRYTDFLIEAHHYAEKRKSKLIEQSDIEKTLREQEFRSARVKENMFELMEKNVLRIQSEGECVGQINGLSYVSFGGYSFGLPARISAQVGIGNGALVDIERESKLGGPIHSKGVLILAGYLRGQFLQHQPFSLSASIVFEQSYGSIDGDSASLAEACVLLSAIAKINLKQNFALTGSIDQHGRVQAVGGVNEKIEAFFDLGVLRAEKGKKGVIIPKSTVKNLMLKEEIVEASKNNKFAIYAVDSVNEAMEILSGMESGERDKKGNFPEKSFNNLVEKALMSYANRVKSFRANSAAGKKNVDASTSLKN